MTAKKYPTDEVLIWSADRKLHSRLEGASETNNFVSLSYFSKGKLLDHMPILRANMTVLQPPVDRLLVLSVPRHLQLDFSNGVYFMPFTRRLFSNHKPSFKLDFMLTPDRESRSRRVPLSYKLCDINKSVVAETLNKYIVGNQVLKLPTVLMIPKKLSSNDIASAIYSSDKNASSETVREAVTSHLSVRDSKIYEVFLVPQFIQREQPQQKLDLDGEYMKDYKNFNTAWSSGNPDERERMRANVIGVRFLAFVMERGELGLDQFAERQYRRALREEKMHLILDLDKTLIKAFKTDPTSLKKLEDLQRQMRENLGVPEEKADDGKGPDDGRPAALRGSDSFKIKFMYNGSESELWIKPRPFLKEFLFEAAKRYEVSIVSMGVPQYVGRVIEGLDKIYPGVAELIPPHRFTSSVYTVTKSSRHGFKDPRMMFPFAYFSNRRNTIVIVDDTVDVWKQNKDDYTPMVLPISRYEGCEKVEVMAEGKSSLKNCLGTLVEVHKRFFAQARSISQKTGAESIVEAAQQCDAARILREVVPGE